MVCLSQKINKLDFGSFLFVFVAFWMGRWGELGIAKNGTSDSNSLQLFRIITKTPRTIMCPVPFTGFTRQIEHPNKTNIYIIKNSFPKKIKKQRLIINEPDHPCEDFHALINSWTKPHCMASSKGFRFCSYDNIIVAERKEN